jgi:hypothetical protein
VWWTEGRFDALVEEQFAADRIDERSGASVPSTDAADRRDMSRSLTLSVPSPRQIALTIVGVVAAIALLIVGVRIGTSILSPSPIMGLAAEGSLHEVQVVGGAVYLGTIVKDDGSTLRLARPAVIRQEAASAASPGAQGPRIIVQSLATDPYGIAADILIPLEQVATVGVVQPSSSLGRAYSEAMGLTQAPAPSPSP